MNSEGKEEKMSRDKDMYIVTGTLLRVACFG